MSSAATQPVVSRPSFQAIGTPIDPRTDELGQLLVSNPRYMALAAAGRVFHATLAVANAVAPLQVVPSTTAAFVLNNISTAANPVCLVPIAVTMLNASGTSDKGQTLFAQVGSTALATQLTANGTGVVVSCGRGGADQSLAWADTSKTVAGGWAAIASMESTADLVPGAGVTVQLHGQFVVRPTFAFGLHVLSGAGTSAKFTFGVTWLELPITLTA